MDSSGLTSTGGAPLRGWTLKSLGMKKGPWSKVTSGKWERRTMHPAAQLDSSPQQSPGGGKGLAPLLRCPLHQRPGFVSLHQAYKEGVVRTDREEWKRTW